MEHHATAKYVLDGVSFVIVGAALANWLPPVASLLSIVWLTIQIGEWATKKWRRRK